MLAPRWRTERFRAIAIPPGPGKSYRFFPVAIGFAGTGHGHGERGQCQDRRSRDFRIRSSSDSGVQDCAVVLGKSTHDRSRRPSPAPLVPGVQHYSRVKEKRKRQLARRRWPACSPLLSCAHLATSLASRRTGKKWSQKCETRRSLEGPRRTATADERCQAWSLRALLCSVLAGLRDLNRRTDRSLAVVRRPTKCSCQTKGSPQGTRSNAFQRQHRNEAAVGRHGSN